jgi:hypothetical protein
MELDTRFMSPYFLPTSPADGEGKIKLVAFIFLVIYTAF